MTGHNTKTAVFNQIQKLHAKELTMSRRFRVNKN